MAGDTAGRATDGGGPAGVGGAAVSGAGGSPLPPSDGTSGTSGRGGAGDAGGAAAGGGGGGGGGTGAGGSATGKSCSDYEGLPTDCLCRDHAEHVYLFCSTLRSWAQGSLRCEFFDMSLVQLESPSEDAWALEQAKAIEDPQPLAFFWTGASSQASPGVWYWPDGSTFWRGDANGTPVDDAYSNWRVASPQSTRSAACVFSGENGWEDGDCATNRGYVCESR